MAVGVEKVEEAVVGVELPDSTQFSSAAERCALSRGEYKFLLVLALRDSRAPARASTVGADCKLTDKPARCEAARRDGLSALMLRLPRDMNSISRLQHCCLAVQAHPYTFSWRLSTIHHAPLLYRCGLLGGSGRSDGLVLNSTVLQARSGQRQRARDAVGACHGPATGRGTVGVEEEKKMTPASRQMVSARAKRRGGRRWLQCQECKVHREVEPAAGAKLNARKGEVRNSEPSSPVNSPPHNLFDASARLRDETTRSRRLQCRFRDGCKCRKSFFCASAHRARP